MTDDEKGVIKFEDGELFYEGVTASVQVGIGPPWNSVCQRARELFCQDKEDGKFDDQPAAFDEMSDSLQTEYIRRADRELTKELN